MGRPVLMWVLDYLSITKEDSIFLAVPAPILKQYDIKKMLARMLPQVGFTKNLFLRRFFRRVEKNGEKGHLLNVVDVTFCFLLWETKGNKNGEMECLQVNFLVGYLLL